MKFLFIILYSLFLWFFYYQNNKYQQNNKNNNNEKNNYLNNIKIQNIKKLKNNNIYSENKAIWNQIKAEIKNLDSYILNLLSKLENNKIMNFNQIKNQIIQKIKKNIADLEKTYLFLNNIDLLTIKETTLRFKITLKDLINTKENKNLEHIILIVKNWDNIYQNIFETQIHKTKQDAKTIINKIEKKLKKYKNVINLEEIQKANLLIEKLKILIINSNNISQINLKIDSLWIFEQEILMPLKEKKEAQKTAIIIIKESKKYLKLFIKQISLKDQNLIKNKINELEHILHNNPKISALIIDKKTLKLTQCIEKIMKSYNIDKIENNKKISNIKSKIINKHHVTTNWKKIYILINIILFFIIMRKHLFKIIKFIIKKIFIFK